MRILAAIVLAGLGLIALSGCHDGYSTVGYSYYGGYGSPSYCAPAYYSYPSISYSFGYHSGHHHHHHGHWGGHHGGHGHYRSHCR